MSLGTFRLRTVNVKRLPIAPVDVGLIALAIGLALLGGLIAGSAGGLRASRLRPADALRHID